jgi:hypothetical protein
MLSDYREQIVIGFTPINAPKQAITVAEDPPPPRALTTNKRQRTKVNNKTLERHKNEEKVATHKRAKQAKGVKAAPLVLNDPEEKERQDQTVVMLNQDHGMPLQASDQHDIQNVEIANEKDYEQYSSSTYGTATFLSPLFEQRPRSETTRKDYAAMFLDDDFGNMQDVASSTVIDLTSDVMPMVISSDTLYYDSGDEYGSIDEDDLDALESTLNPSSSIKYQTLSDPCQQDSLNGGFGDVDKDPLHWTQSHIRGSKTIMKPFKSLHAHKAFVRPRPAPPVRDRSPIIGVSASSTLRVCFRIGEVINFGHAAINANQMVVFELYARVASSERESAGVKQHFEFWDIFHDKPPYITGHYDLWKGNDLWDYESGQFLEFNDGMKFCRCICRPKKVDDKLTLMILNIWESSWDDVEYVKGIVMPLY